jgi:hypothetical protein
VTANGVRVGAATDLTPALDPQSRLAHGALLQASVRARLLGVPLLRLEATVAIVPARVTASPSATNEAPRRALTRSRAASPQSGGLAEAVRSINEGAELLAEVRRNGS